MSVISKETNMERRKIIKKNESKPKSRTIKVGSVAKKVEKATKKKTDLRLPLTLDFMSKPFLYKAFEGVAKEKQIPMGEIVLSFAALGLKAYLAEVNEALQYGS